MSALERKHKEAEANAADNAQQKCNQHKATEQYVWHLFLSQNIQHKSEMDTLKIAHKQQMREEVREVRRELVDRQKRIDTIESELFDYIETYTGMSDEYQLLKRDSGKLSAVHSTSKQRMMKVRELKEIHRRTEAKVVNEQLNVM